MNSDLRQSVEEAWALDPLILVPKEEVEKSLGQDPGYLKSLGLEKHHLIRLERLGLAVKARYQTTNKTGKAVFVDNDKNPIPVTGPQRTRWIIFKEAFL